jgi:phage portal protein BeeE
LNTLKGLSPLQAGLYALTGSTDIQKAQSVLVKNQGVRGLLTNESNRNGGGVSMGETEAKEVKKSLNGIISGIDKINSVAITSATLKYHAMGMSTSDLKLIESVVLTDRQLCNAYNVDSVLFNDQESSTRDNKNIAEKGLYLNAILPRLNKIVDRFNQDISKGINREENTNYEVRVDIRDIEALQKDQKVEAEKNRINALGIKDVLASSTDVKGKVEILMTIYRYDEDRAKLIVGNGQITED